MVYSKGMFSAVAKLIKPNDGIWFKVKKIVDDLTAEAEDFTTPTVVA